jgi:hypothetical protein
VHKKLAKTKKIEADSLLASPIQRLNPLWPFSPKTRKMSNKLRLDFAT